MRDLLLLVADKNAEFAVRGALERPAALGVRGVTYEVIVDPSRDGGVRTRGPEILRVRRTSFDHAVMMFDHEGCGTQQSALDLERVLNSRLDVTWAGNAKAIVVEPEVDAWIWGADTHVQHVTEWDQTVSVRQWLRGQGFSFNSQGKPERPKEALEAVLKCTNVARSSALYKKLTARTTLSRCSDPAFVRLRAALQSWFPASAKR